MGQSGQTAKNRASVKHTAMIACDPLPTIAAKLQQRHLRTKQKEQPDWEKFAIALWHTCGSDNRLDNPNVDAQCWLTASPHLGTSIYARSLGVSQNTVLPHFAGFAAKYGADVQRRGNSPAGHADEFVAGRVARRCVEQNRVGCGWAFRGFLTGDRAQRHVNTSGKTYLVVPSVATIQANILS
jgi:hypothetical protein